MAPCGATLPWGVDSVGAQLLGPRGGAGTVCAGGVTGVGGACALAGPDAASIASERKIGFLVMLGNDLQGHGFPAKSAQVHDLR